MNTIKIQISGLSATGKTTLAKIIQDALTKEGFIVNQNDIDLIDNNNVDERILRNKEDLRQKGLIVDIDTIQLRKSPMN